MYFVVKIDHINFLCKKTTLKSIKSFKILTSVGFIAYRSHCSRKRQYQSVTQVVSSIIIVRAGSVPVDTTCTLHHPNYFLGWFFFTNTSPQTSHFCRPSLIMSIAMQNEKSWFCYMKLNYTLIQHVNFTPSFIKLYNKIVLAHKISGKYLTMLDIDLLI